MFCPIKTCLCANGQFNPHVGKVHIRWETCTMIFHHLWTSTLFAFYYTCDQMFFLVSPWHASEYTGKWQLCLVCRQYGWDKNVVYLIGGWSFPPENYLLNDDLSGLKVSSLVLQVHRELCLFFILLAYQTKKIKLRGIMKQKYT